MNMILQGELPRWKSALKMIVNPGDVVKRQMSKVPWPYSLSISGLAFGLFFLQTGIDMLRAGQIDYSTVILITMLGIVYGTAGLALVALLAWSLARGSERQYDIAWAVSAFALGYSATLVYALIGLIFSLMFGWHTAVAFGVTGVLWALRPTIMTIRQMSGERVGFSIAVSTVCGAVLLFGWSLLGRFGL